MHASTGARQRCSRLHLAARPRTRVQTSHVCKRSCRWWRRSPSRASTAAHYVVGGGRTKDKSVRAQTTAGGVSRPQGARHPLAAPAPPAAAPAAAGAAPAAPPSLPPPVAPRVARLLDGSASAGLGISSWRRRCAHVTTRSALARAVLLRLDAVVRLDAPMDARRSRWGPVSTDCHAVLIRSVRQPPAAICAHRCRLQGTLPLTGRCPDRHRHEAGLPNTSLKGPFDTKIAFARARNTH